MRLRLRVLRLLVAAFALALATGACAGVPRMSAWWREPTATPETFRPIAVLFVSPDSALRSGAAALAAQLSRGGSPAFALDPSGATGLDSAAVETVAREIGATGLLVARVLDSRAVQASYPQITSFLPVPASNERGWWAMAQEEAFDPAKVGPGAGPMVRFEANLYRLRDGRLVASGLGEAVRARELHSAEVRERWGRALAQALVPPRERP